MKQDLETIIDEICDIVYDDELTDYEKISLLIDSVLVKL